MIDSTFTNKALLSLYRIHSTLVLVIRIGECVRVCVCLQLVVCVWIPQLIDFKYRIDFTADSQQAISRTLLAEQAA